MNGSTLPSRHLNHPVHLSPFTFNFLPFIFFGIAPVVVKSSHFSTPEFFRNSMTIFSSRLNLSQPNTPRITTTTRVASTTSTTWLSKMSLICQREHTTVDRGVSVPDQRPVHPSLLTIRYPAHLINPLHSLPCISWHIHRTYSRPAGMMALAEVPCGIAVPGLPATATAPHLP